MKTGAHAELLTRLPELGTNLPTLQGSGSRIMTPEEKRDNRGASQRKYERSAKGCARKKTYSLSAKGRATRKKYQRSERGRAALSRYNKSEKGKQRKAWYQERKLRG